LTQIDPVAFEHAGHLGSRGPQRLKERSRVGLRADLGRAGAIGTHPKVRRRGDDQINGLVRERGLADITVHDDRPAAHRDHRRWIGSVGIRHTYRS
jgi:hypothetical protein